MCCRGVVSGRIAIISAGAEKSHPWVLRFLEPILHFFRFVITRLEPQYSDIFRSRFECHQSLTPKAPSPSRRAKFLVVRNCLSNCPRGLCCLRALLNAPRPGLSCVRTVIKTPRALAPATQVISGQRCECCKRSWGRQCLPRLSRASTRGARCPCDEQQTAGSDPATGYAGVRLGGLEQRVIAAHPGAG